MEAIQAYPRRHLITVDEYLRMGEAYVFGPHACIELMEGELIEMAPISSAHASVVCTLDTLLREIASSAMLRVQSSILLGERSAPQPDVMLLRPRADRYYNSHPTAEDAVLVVEVADKTLMYDLEVKRPVYARAGIAELWIVDITRRELDVFREPKVEYSMHRVLAGPDSVEIAATGDVVFSVSDLFRGS